MPPEDLLVSEKTIHPLLTFTTATAVLKPSTLNFTSPGQKGHASLPLRQMRNLSVSEGVSQNAVDGVKFIDYLMAYIAWQGVDINHDYEDDRDVLGENSSKNAPKLYELVYSERTPEERRGNITPRSNNFQRTNSARRVSDSASTHVDVLRLNENDLALLDSTKNTMDKVDELLNYSREMLKEKSQSITELKKNHKTQDRSSAEHLDREMEAVGKALDIAVQVERSLTQLSISTEKRLNDIINAQFVAVRNWNEEFQKILDLPQRTTEERVKRFEQISQLASEFERTSILYGKIIINEETLSIDQKTIKPISIGGQAGGEKYVHAGILYKFAKDWKGIYGGDEFCMKSASNEQKGLTRYFSAGVGLRVPLMSLIDYMGYRLIAISILPIDKSTLQYGSMDFGRNMASPTPECSMMMKRAASHLNLKAHVAGVSGRMIIYGPVDIEVHLGSDQRYYLIDAARTFAPTTPMMDIKSCYLWQLFRPEFVKSNPVPLSSDAFSPSDREDPDRMTHRQEVMDATNKLINVVIPSFAASLDHSFNRMNQDISAVIKILKKTFIHDLHRAGINVRYLGVVRNNTQNPFIRRYILMEMIARTIKNMLRYQLRTGRDAQNRKIRGIFGYKQVVLNLFNQIIGENSPNSAYFRRNDGVDFWRGQLEPAMARKFRDFPSSNQLRAEIMTEDQDPTMMIHKCIVMGICTFNATGEHYTEQPFYNCFTCNLIEDLGCCVVCSERCHKGHNISASSKMAKFFCDCQGMDLCKISSSDMSYMLYPSDVMPNTTNWTRHKAQPETKSEDVQTVHEYGEYDKDEDIKDTAYQGNSPSNAPTFISRDIHALPTRISTEEMKKEATEEYEEIEEEEEEYEGEEHILKYLVRSSMGFYWLFKRVAKISGIKISKYCRRSLKKHGDGFTFEEVDIEDFIVRSKPMDFIAAAEANGFALRARIEAEQQNASTRNNNHLLDGSTTLGSSTDTTSMYNHNWNPILFGKQNEQGKAKGNRKLSRMFSLSQAKFEQALSASPDSRETLDIYAKFLLDMSFRSLPHIDWRLLAEAVEKYRDLSRLDVIMNALATARKHRKWSLQFNLFQKETYKVILESPSLMQYGAIVESIDLTEGQLTYDNVQSMCQFFVNITRLNLADCKGWSEDFHDILKHCKHIRHLDISGTTEVDNLSFEGGTNIVYLNITRCSFNPGKMGLHLPSLEQLICPYSDIFLNYPDSLHSICRYCTRLVSLICSGFVALEDKNIKWISQRTSLRSIAISSANLRSKSYKQLAQQLTQLEELTIERSDVFDDECLSSLLTKGKNFKVLNIPFCSGITRDCIVSSLGYLSNLISLRISGNANITNNTIFSIVRACPSIEVLDISYCIYITVSRRERGARLTKSQSAAVHSVAQSLRSLEHLNISGCPKLNDEAVIAMCNSPIAPRLTTLNLSATEIGDESIQLITDHFPNLIALLIDSCKNINYSSLKRLITDKLSLQHLSLKSTAEAHKDMLGELRPLLFKCGSLIFYEPFFSIHETDLFLSEKLKQ
ncbi:hypothetical protein PROFUN_03738 [Planoprotostelium fungivorum]|uniref:UBR-type domain-containing protein n=1 Tax=Planoprotostelium fungivorum TaxID=1890364 RepID=A0A2P6NDL7_9EUKA|nr:hypothetical protein PROFUN_03738 [Planoprotostelium fungivorum]